MFKARDLAADEKESAAAANHREPGGQAFLSPVIAQPPGREPVASEHKSEARGNEHRRADRRRQRHDGAEPDEPAAPTGSVDAGRPAIGAALAANRAAWGTPNATADIE
jgi:hypothetical protein